MSEGTRSRAPWIVGGMILLVGVVGVLVFYLMQGNPSSSGPAESSSSPVLSSPAVTSSSPAQTSTAAAPSPSTSTTLDPLAGPVEIDTSRMPVTYDGIKIRSNNYGGFEYFADDGRGYLILITPGGDENIDVPLKGWRWYDGFQCGPSTSPGTEGEPRCFYRSDEYGLLSVSGPVGKTAETIKLVELLREAYPGD